MWVGALHEIRRPMMSLLAPHFRDVSHLWGLTMFIRVSNILQSPNQSIIQNNIFEMCLFACAQLGDPSNIKKVHNVLVHL